MKKHYGFGMLSFLLAITLFVGVMQAVAETAVLPQASEAVAPTALVLVTPSTQDNLKLMQEADVTLYARLRNSALLVGANTNSLQRLAAAKLPYQLVDADIDGAHYVLVDLLPGQRGVEWEKYGRFLLNHHNDTILLDVTPAQVAQLANDGFQTRAVTFDSKPFQPAQSNIPAAIQPDPIIQTMMDQVISNTVYQYDGNLSGEWPVTIGGLPYTIASRNTYSGEPLQKATQFVGEHLAGLGMDVEYHQWHGTYPPNVIGEITGQINPDEIYIISAHLDDMPSGATAPGADDNASGVVAALIAADILSQYNWGCTIRFGLWTGEEQGLLGSNAYAQRSFNADENIAGVLNLDMIAWNTANSSRGIDLHANSSLPDTLLLAQLFADVVSEYNLDLIPEIVPNGSGSSDHASFWNYGYTSILGIEDFGDFNPYYHTTNDLLQNIDLDYFTEFVRASIGSFAHMTGCLIPDGIGYMDGTITAADGGAAIAGATIMMNNADGGNLTAVSANNGYYTHTLLADTYTVTAAAYGFLPGTITDVVILTDTVTTQDFALQTAPSYTISGTVTAADNGLPLAAQIAFQGSPVTVNSDPATGVYQATLPLGEYTMRVTADGYRPAERMITADQNQIQDFGLEPLPPILLVDDDNNSPDLQPMYTAVLDALGHAYDIFDVGGGSGDGPALAELNGYETVIWFSGDKYDNDSAGPNSGDEVNLAAFLDGGGRLFLSSQDYLYDMGLTSFAQSYLGVGSFSNDNGNATTKYGLADDPIGDGSGPYSLSYPSGFSDYGDVVSAGAGASLAFRDGASGGNGLDVDKDGGAWKTVFFATSWVPVYNNNVANGEELMARILNWFTDDENACVPITEITLTQTTTDTIYMGDMAAFRVDIAPETAVSYTYTVTISETAVFTNQPGSSNPLQFQHTFNDSGNHPVTVDLWNCPLTTAVTDTLAVMVEEYRLLYLPVVTKPAD